MPGYTSLNRRTAQIIVRVTQDDKRRWTEYADEGRLYLSPMVRMAVNLFIEKYPNPMKAPRVEPY